MANFRYLRVFLGGVLLALSAVSLGLDYGEAEQGADNVVCWVAIGIPGVEADDDLISGTNINLTNGAGVRTNPEWTGWPTYTDGQFYKVEVRMDDDLVYSKEYTPSTGGAGGAFSSSFWGMELAQQHQPANIRFTSTNFSHNEAVPIVVKCWFALFDEDEWVETVTVTATISPKPYNYVALWKTIYNRYGCPWVSPDTTTINEILIDGRQAFGCAANYGNHVRVDDDLAAAEADLEPATAIFAVTHGHYAGIAHAEGWDESDSDHWLTWSQIDALVDDEDHGLGFAWVVLYACEAFDNAGSVADAFSLRETNGVFLGFDGNVWPYARRTSDDQIVTLAPHADLLKSKLLAGYSAADALSKTQDVYVPRTGNSGGDDDLPMELAGDGLSTLMWVYLSSTERQALPGSEKTYDEWMLVMEKPSSW